jgi:hypothetical protein
MPVDADADEIAVDLLIERPGGVMDLVVRVG